MSKLQTRSGTGPYGENRIGIWSGCGAYRYSLIISTGIDSDRTLVVIGMNPSKANQIRNDNTVKMMWDKAKNFGCKQLVMLNAYGIMQTDSRKLFQYEDPNGDHNDEAIRDTLSVLEPEKTTVLVCWGEFVQDTGRGAQVYNMVLNAGHTPYCLQKNASGAPRHPRGIPKFQELRVYTL